MTTGRALNILLCEDSDDDSAMLEHELRKSGYQPAVARVQTQAEMSAALEAGHFDVIFSDWSMPGFSALEALELYLQSGLDIPFIIVSGTIGEDVAVRALRAGAHDFILKGHLARLVPALERELRETGVRAERNTMREQLMVADRMASMGTLAAGVAHEINNPLAALIANLDVARTDLESLQGNTDFGELTEVLQDTAEAAERIRAVVRDLKIFSRGNEEKRTAVDVHRVLESTLRMAWNEIRHRAQLIKTYGELPLVDGTESRLGQLFLNLVMNAAQAIPEGRASAHQIRVGTSTDERGRAVIEIADTGAGMAPDVQSRLFTPFFTTKPPGIGTGLGLSICHRIVTEFGGTIEVRSAPGAGTTFRVRLLAAAAELQPRPAPVATAAQKSERRGKVLVVDDEVILGKAIERTLGPEHEVTVLNSAELALERITGGERYDVILCDLMMPQMTGIDLFNELSRLAPDQAQRMIFLSGGAFTHHAQQFLDTTDHLKLEKPFDIHQLQSLVNERVRSTGS